MPTHKFIVLLISLCFWSITASHADELSTPIPAMLEGSVKQYAADGDTLLLWLPSEAGIPYSVNQVALQLTQQHIEVWLVDLLAANFLPVAASSLPEIPETQVSELLQHAIEKTGKKVYLIGSGRASIPILHGSRRWQLENQKQQSLAGVILISPKFYIETPDPGAEPALLPIVTASNLPIHIIQPANSPWRWKLMHTIPALETGGSDVSLHVLRDVRDRFYYRPDATTREQQLADRLSNVIQTGIELLNINEPVTRRAVVDTVTGIKLSDSKKQRELKPYKGNPEPPPLLLKDLNEQPHALTDYRGEVVLVNFWASWCPPCVHEMPSMQRLQDRYEQDDFKILAVNMAEDKPTIEQFLREKVSVNFSILQDKDGSALKQWGVFAFPTSFLIDKQGQIRYALFGAVDWEGEDIRITTEDLLAE